MPQDHHSRLVAIRRWGAELVQRRRSARAQWPELAVLVMAALLTTGESIAGEAIVSWLPNSESDLAGYNVYYGTQPQAYNQTVNVGNVTAAVISGLTAGTAYYFAVTAYDTSGNESGYSAEVSKTIASAPDTTPPGGVRNFTATGGDQQITLSWTNPADADFIGVRIRYRTDHYPVDINDGVLVGDFTGQPNAAMSTAHAGLQNGVIYYYLASSYDLSRNYQSTAHASAVPQADQPIGQIDAGGGCGGAMAGLWRPAGGSSGGQSGMNLVPSYLVILLVGLLKWRKKLKQIVAFFSPRYSIDAWNPAQAAMPAHPHERPDTRLVHLGLRRGGYLVLESQ